MTRKLAAQVRADRRRARLFSVPCTHVSRPRRERRKQNERWHNGWGKFSDWIETFQVHGPNRKVKAL